MQFGLCLVGLKYPTHSFLNAVLIFSSLFKNLNCGDTGFFISKGSSYICVTVYYHLKHLQLVAMATEQHKTYNIVQNQTKNLLRVSILNMSGCSKEGFSLKSSFAVLIPLHFCRASLQGARHSWYNFNSVYAHALCVACAWLVRACIVCPSGFLRAITCTFMHGFQNNLAQLLTLTRRSAI